MSEPTHPNSTDLVRSLRLIRSADPADRRRGIEMLNTVQDDPRVVQVFERLYQNDPDPGVRDAAWQALAQIKPAAESVPAPAAITAPPPAPRRPGSEPTMVSFSRRKPGSEPTMMTMRRKAAQAPVARRRISRRTLFLLNPANAKIVAKERDRALRRKRSSQADLWLAVVLLVIAVGLWGWLAGLDHADHPLDDRVVIGAVGLLMAVVLLSFLSLIRRRGGLRNRRILRGLIVECEGQTDDDGDFKLRIQYRFRAPKGQIVTAQVRQIRNDLRNKPLPAPGGTVAVYFRSARSFRLL
jgi:hypothetical protein